MLTIADLKRLKTKSQGHSEDLKIQTSTTRIWLNRCTGKIDVEKFDGTRWDTVANGLTEVEDPR